METKFRTPRVNEQAVLCPPPMVAIDLRIWSSARGEEQRSYKVWCPDTDELLALVVEPQSVRSTGLASATWLVETYRRLWELYCNPEPFS